MTVGAAAKTSARPRPAVDRALLGRIGGSPSHRSPTTSSSHQVESAPVEPHPTSSLTTSSSYPIESARQELIDEIFQNLELFVDQLTGRPAGAGP